MDTVQKRALLSGRVQGVGFRHFTRMNARELNIKGWVKNRSDGKVEAVIQGSSDSIDEMLERLRKGPGSARVDDIKIEGMEVDEKFDSFNVRRW
jgi:acylphosphatase